MGTEPEALTPDEVTPGTAVVPATPDTGRDSALVAAAEAALDAPGAIDHTEFWALAAQARILCMSGAAPKAVRQDPHLALHLALVGRDLGISASAALELIDVIKVRDGEYRLSLSPQLMNGQLRKLGLGCILPAERTAWRCEAVAFGPGGPDRECTRTGVVAHVEGCACDVLGTSEFTWEDAQMAGLAGADCEPGKHHVTTRSSGNRTWKACGCNQGYITYPKRMLWWRASGFAGDDYFPEAGLGLYSPEALGASVGPDGRPIDVDSVELPPGYEPQAIGSGRNGAGAPPPAERMADPGELWTLQERIQALPEGHRAELRAAWMGEDSRLKGWKPYDMPHRLLTNANAMVNAFWGKAKAASIDMNQELDQLRKHMIAGLFLFFANIWAPGRGETGPQEPQEPPEGPPAPEPTPVPESAGDEPGASDADPSDWASQLDSTAREVRELSAKVPAEVGKRIGEISQAMHWQRINGTIAAAGDAAVAAFPPSSPIDLRRMAVCALFLEQFLATGELPEE